MRRWYIGPGAATMVAATCLVRRLKNLRPENDIRLFEGFVSFKRRGDRGKIVGPDKLRMSEDNVLRSAFKVAGMDLGIPAAVFADCEA